MRFSISFKSRQNQGLLHRLQEHFGCEPRNLPVISETFPLYQHADLHNAVEAYLADDDRDAEIVGVTCENKMYSGVHLAELVVPADERGSGHAQATEGPVEYSNVSLGEAGVLTCVSSGLYLIKEGLRRTVLLLDASHEMGPFRRLMVEVMAARPEQAKDLLAALRTEMRRSSVYRGRVISLDLDSSYSLRVNFHRLPHIDHDGIILPPGLLDRIERQTVRFTALKEQLVAARRHLKRGVLLHGAPGTGKTLTAMYLASAFKNRTVLLVTGMGQGLIGQTCAAARALQPSTVVLEDVDLIARERRQSEGGCSLPLLFELLNQMDGLAEDADVLFLLTTNRADLLEPALAARPGRIDLAVEIPLPDEDCRRRLFGLYAHGLSLRVADLDQFIQRTEGASGAFIKELLRKAALIAAEESESEGITVKDEHLDQALRELVVEGGTITHSLLGFRPNQVATPRDTESDPVEADQNFV
jgi:hypothetical protein